MGQIKVFGLKKKLDKRKLKMSEVIHSCVVDGLKLPGDKKFHRFFPLETGDFYFPNDRSENYTIVEISMFEGRSVDAKKDFIRLMYQKFQDQLNISANDLELTIFETPKSNWGIRGLPGDELTLNYKVDL